MLDFLISIGTLNILILVTSLQQVLYMNWKIQIPR